MAIEGIKITLGEVTKTSGTIRQLNNNLDNKLTEIKKQMNDLAQTWESDASNTIRQKFNSLVPKFAEYKNIIESYSKFLDTTVQSYDSAETAINNNASSFK